jgi:hypothetical protein
MVAGLYRQATTPTRLIQRSTASLLIVAFSIFGLLNVPTECACGSLVPHPHSLFLISHHHHDADGHEASSHAALDAHEDEIPLLGDTDRPGPTIRDSHSSSSTEQQLAAVTGIGPWGMLTGLEAGLFSTDLTRVGQTITPEPPPPQSHP